MPGIFSIFYSAVLSVHGVMVLCPLSRYIGFGEKMKAGVVEREREREREFMRARTEAPRGCVRVKGRASKRACEQTRESNICLITLAKMSFIRPNVTSYWINTESRDWSIIDDFLMRTTNRCLFHAELWVKA